MPAKTPPIPLAELVAGQCGTLLSLTDQRPVTSRLASLGFTPGVEINMIQNYGRGPLIVIVRGMRVALGRGEAARILIQRSVE